MTVSACRKTLQTQLSSVAGDCAGMEAEQIMIAAMDCSRSFLYTYPEREIDALALTQIQQTAAKRVQGEPLQYILGQAPFMGLEFVVRPGVLIPRQDTEILVENALPYCKDKKVLDLCAGSGCIGISVARLGTPSCVALSDISSEALRVAEENAEKHGVSPVFYQGDFLRGIPEGETFEVVLSNPPYITSAEMDALPGDVKDYEPTLALEAGEDGLDAYRKILKEITRVLVSGGYLFFEIGFAQGDAVRTLMEQHGFTEVRILQDYGGRDRVVYGCLK